MHVTLGSNTDITDTNACIYSRQYTWQKFPHMQMVQKSSYCKAETVLFSYCGPLVLPYIQRFCCLVMQLNNCTYFILQAFSLENIYYCQSRTFPNAVIQGKVAFINHSSVFDNNITLLPYTRRWMKQSKSQSRLGKKSQGHKDIHFTGILGVIWNYGHNNFHFTRCFKCFLPLEESIV